MRSPRHAYTQTNGVRDADLIEARRIAALVINQFGDKYAPLFDILDEECRRRAYRQRMIESCLDLPLFEPLRSLPRRIEIVE